MTTPTPKQRVLAKRPNSWKSCLPVFGGWMLWVGLKNGDGFFVTGPTPAAAWRDAAERMK